MNFEALKERVTLIQYSEGRHTQSGEPILTVLKEVKAFAQFKAANSSEVFQSDRSVSFALGSFFLRWRTDIDGHWKIRDRRGRLWQIIGEPKEIGFKDGIEVAVQLAN